MTSNFFCAQSWLRFLRRMLVLSVAGISACLLVPVALAQQFEQEPNDSTANIITPGISMTGQLSSATDVDAFYVEATGPGTMTVTIAGRDKIFLVGWQVGIFNSALSTTPLASTTVSGQGFNSTAMDGTCIGDCEPIKSLTTQLSAAGKYMVAVTSLYATLSPSQPYTLTVTGSAFLPGANTTAPTIPTGLRSVSVRGTQIDLMWNPSADYINVKEYKIFRNGVLVGSSGLGSYTDSGLATSTTYTYTVAACDAAGSCSAQSSPASAATGSIDASATATGSASALNLTSTIYPTSSFIGNGSKAWIALLRTDGSVWFNGGADGFVQYRGGDAPAYSEIGGGTVTISFQGWDTRTILGGNVYVGYGTSFLDMLNNLRFTKIHTLR